MSVISVDKGKKIYQKNTVFRDLANVMEHPEFRAFVDKYFNTSADAQAILMLMQTYKKIEESNQLLNPYQKIAVLKEVITNNKAREAITNDFINWRNNASIG